MMSDDEAPTAPTRGERPPPLLSTALAYYCQRCHTPCSEQDLLVGTHVGHDHLSLAEALAHGPSGLLRETKKTLERMEDHYYRPLRAHLFQWQHASETLVVERARKEAQIIQLQEEIGLIDKDLDEMEESAALAGCHWLHHRQQLEQELLRLNAGSHALRKLLELGGDSTPATRAERSEDDAMIDAMDRFLQERHVNHDVSIERDLSDGKASTRRLPAVVRASAQTELCAVHELTSLALARLLAENPLETTVEAMRRRDLSQRGDSGYTTLETGTDATAHAKTTALTSQRVHPSDSVSTLLRAALSRLEHTAAEKNRESSTVTRAAASADTSTERPDHKEDDERPEACDANTEEGQRTVTQRSADPSHSSASAQRRRDPGKREAWQHAFDDLLRSLQRPIPVGLPHAQDGAALSSSSSQRCVSDEREGSSGACSSIAQYQRDVLSQLRAQRGVF